jgi:Cu-processing system permease protein
VPRVLVLARHTLFEAIRNRLVVLCLIVLLGGLGLSVFFKEITLTESAQVQTALLASVFRLAAVFLLAAFVVSSQVREASDKGLELVLSLSLPRVQYVAGKLIGYCVVALVLASLFSLPLMLHAPVSSVAVWGVSLFCELCIVAAASLFCVLTFNHVIVALTVVTGFYVLARLIAVFQLIGASQLGEQAGLFNKAANGIVFAIAFVLPRLDTFTQTAWLVNVHDAHALGLVALQSVAYVVLLLSATLFDFYRRSF